MSYSSYKSRFQQETKKSMPLSHAPTNIQKQLQIQELDQKVDVILQHNNQLKDENQALKKKILFMESSGGIRGSGSRASLSEKRQLELKIIEIEQLKKQSIIDKELFSTELDNLTSTLNIVTERRNSLEMERTELQTKIFSLQTDFELTKNKMQEDLKKALYEENVKKNLQKNELIKEMKNNFNEQLDALKKQWEEEKASLNEKRLQSLADMENKYEKEVFQIKRKLQEKTRQQINNIQNTAIEKCKKQRQKAEEYIQSMLETHKQMQQYDQEELKKQISDLKDSLQSRQKVIEGLLHVQEAPDNTRYYQQSQELRKRIKDLTQSFFKEAELLKVKMAVKHQSDVKEVQRAYGDRLNICQARIKHLEHQNDRLRQNYEQEVRNKLKLRQKFEIEISKLKGIIRKMKIELETYGKQVRFNIDGMKDQANSFSMSMMTELSQEKNKKNFFEEQIRKMREVLDLKEQEVAQVTKQTQEKVRYFEDKLESYKKKVEELNDELKEKDNRYKNDMEEKDRWARMEQEKQQNHFTEEIQNLQKLIEDQKQKYHELEEDLQAIKDEKKVREEEIAHLQHQLELSKAHIQSLRLEMQMFSENVKPDDALKPLKDHYQRIIEQMHKDKEVLKEENSMQADQITKLVAKYQDLQRTLQKTLSTMKKHSQLNQKVMELGLDNNLVKNLAQIFQNTEQ